jgi:hypothetical protein
MKRSINTRSALRIPFLLTYHRILSASRQKRDGDLAQTIVERTLWMTRITCRRYLFREMGLMGYMPDMQQLFRDPVMLEFGWVDHNSQPQAADTSRRRLHRQQVYSTVTLRLTHALPNIKNHILHHPTVLQYLSAIVSLRIRHHLRSRRPDRLNQMQGLKLMRFVAKWKRFAISFSMIIHV